MEQVKNHQSVDWLKYFQSIKTECPWSLRAFEQGLIDIVEYSGHAIPLGNYSARVYVIRAPDETVEAICAGLNYGQDEWLFSYPGYGPYATPVSVLIQQDRKTLESLRSKLNGE